ncbi:hypothetical protein D3C76_1610170 [compost metagenome]
MNAIATAKPVAADVNIGNVTASICDRYDRAFSPVYDCQLVLVMKDAAVLNACAAGMLLMPSGLSGRNCCSRSTRNIKINMTKLEMSTADRYFFQPIDSFSRTPINR